MVWNYSYEQKSAFIDAMQRDILAAEEEVTRLSATVDRSASAESAARQLKLDQLRVQLALAKQRLAQVELSEEPTWNDVVSAFRDSYGGMKDTVRESNQWLVDAPVQ